MLVTSWWNLGYLKILRTTRRISFSTLYIRKYVENGRSLVSSGWEKGGGSLFLSKRTSVLYAGRARVKNWKDHQQREWERRREGDFHRNLFIEFESFPRRLLDRLPSALNEEEDQRGDEKVWEAKQSQNRLGMGSSVLLESVCWFESFMSIWRSRRNAVLRNSC